ncbi:MAG: EthD domain-containing protein [Sphingomonadaceae bacterium]
MIKVISLFKRKKGTSHEQFRQYYENNHVKIFKDLHGLAGYERYVRRYLTPIKRFSPGGSETADFDVIMENWFTPELYQRFFETPNPFDADFLKIVAEDEENLFDRTQMFVHNVDEHESSLPVSGVERPGLKKIVTLGMKKPGMSAEKFKDYYENTHAKLVEKYLPAQGVEHYARRYLTPMIDIISGNTPSSGVDIITELWLSDNALFEKFVAQGTVFEAEANKILGTDAEKFLALDGMVTYTVEERDTVLAQSSLQAQLSIS